MHQGSGRSDPWVFDALEVAKWHFGGRNRRSSSTAGDIDSFSPQERKAWFESEMKRQALDEQSRRLIPVEEVEQVIATSFAAIAQGLQGLPDTIERRTGCSAEMVEAIQAVVEAEMDSLATRLAVIGPTDGAEENDDDL